MKKICYSTAFVISAIVFTPMLLVMSFDEPGCQHIYTSVEPIEITTGLSLKIYEDGKELVCVKCFHVTKQKVNYVGLGSVPSTFNFGRTTLEVRDAQNYVDTLGIK